MVSVWVGRQRFEIGEAEFLKAFFSTIFAKAEDRNWGRDYPVIMREFYSGRLRHEDASTALEELAKLGRVLRGLPPRELVWDFEDPQKGPPWANGISPHITSLANYFVTSDGKDLLAVLAQAFAEAAKRQVDAVIH
jgi:2,3-bisphosphoglycerate-dependent phosphoglycerate mutase